MASTTMICSLLIIAIGLVMVDCSEEMTLSPEQFKALVMHVVVSDLNWPYFITITDYRDSSHPVVVVSQSHHLNCVPLLWTGRWNKIHQLLDSVYLSTLSALYFIHIKDRQWHRWAGNFSFVYCVLFQTERFEPLMRFERNLQYWYLPVLYASNHLQYMWYDAFESEQVLLILIESRLDFYGIL